jgi:hypothetical protein
MRYSDFQKYLFGFFSLLLVCAAIHHLYEYFVPQLRPEYPPLRHIVFFTVNLVLALLMLKRRKRYVPLFFLICVQQLYGHGGNLIDSWLNDRSALYLDLVVVLLVPIVFGIYAYDVFKKKT